MPPLKTETNTAAMRRRIEEAFKVSRYARLNDCYEASFEHGQWWVMALDSGAQWSVFDADGPGSIDGFDFELVSAA